MLQVRSLRSLGTGESRPLNQTLNVHYLAKIRHWILAIDLPQRVDFCLSNCMNHSQQCQPACDALKSKTRRCGGLVTLLRAER